MVSRISVGYAMCMCGSCAILFFIFSFEYQTFYDVINWTSTFFFFLVLSVLNSILFWIETEVCSINNGIEHINILIALIFQNRYWKKQRKYHHHQHRLWNGKQEPNGKKRKKKLPIWKCWTRERSPQTKLNHPDPQTDLFHIFFPSLFLCVFLYADVRLI